MNTAKRYYPLRVILPGAIFLAVAAAVAIGSAMAREPHSPGLLLTILPVASFLCCVVYGQQAGRWSWLAPLGCIGVIALVGAVFQYPIFYIPDFWVFLISPFAAPIYGYLMGRAYVRAKKD